MDTSPPAHKGERKEEAMEKLYWIQKFTNNQWYTLDYIWFPSYWAAKGYARGLGALLPHYRIIATEQDYGC